jgi:hypothetical protein
MAAFGVEIEQARDHIAASENCQVIPRDAWPI